MSSSEPHDSGTPRGDYFATTRWTMVLAAGRRTSPQAEHALNELCQTYWTPLYLYVRRQGHSREDAEDFVQAFFARLLENNGFAGLRSERGRFRAFLLASIKHFLANEWDRSQRQKRGGGALHLSLDWKSAEDRLCPEPTDLRSPDRAFDRDWALALLERVVSRLREECAGEGKGPLFEAVSEFLMLGESDTPYAPAAQRLGLTEGALRVAVFRLRQRYRGLLQNEIAQTLEDPALAAEEIQSLQRALQS